MSHQHTALDLLGRGGPQLPVASYFDEALFRAEQALLFDNAPRYIAHEHAVPEIGDYCALPQEGEGRALLRTPQGLRLVSNVCRHRQATMLHGRGRTGSHIVCPLHRWTYDTQGRLLGAPHFEHDPCRHLESWPLQSWNGLLFEAGSGSVAAELAHIGPSAALDFSGHVLDRIELHECRYNWKTFIEVYLEDYHVGPFHPGLGAFVSCDDLRWEFGRGHSVQTVGVQAGLQQPGSNAYRRWQEALRACAAEPSAQGAIWLTCFPTVMVEWYPQVLVVSTLFARGPSETLNLVEFHYPEAVAAFDRELVEAHQAAYMETCAEDDEIALRMEAGRRALQERGDDDAGPYQSPMEDGMRHFHEWYRRVMTEADASATPGGPNAAGRLQLLTGPLGLPMI